VSGAGLAQDEVSDSVRTDRDGMTRYDTIATLALALLAAGGLDAWAVAATPPPGLEAPESTLSPSGLDTAERPAVIGRERAPTGNPLWGIPLRVLTATRERPLFSPSRRPPAPPVVAAAPPPRPVVAPKPPEPDHPLLTIVGTIVGESDAIGVFIDAATNDVIRLHTGQDHDGWTLRTVRGREATFEKSDRHATLALPAPGASPSPPPAPAANQPIPVALPARGAPSAPAAPQAGNTWMDGDGQMIAPPKLYQAAGQRRE
jgi:general secretion pathway protein N